MSWKSFMNEQLISISKASGMPYDYMFKNCYAELEMVERISLEHLMLKMRKDAVTNGTRYYNARRINRLDVIQSYPKLKLTFTEIVEAKHRHYVMGDSYEYKKITR